MSGVVVQAEGLAKAAEVAKAAGPALRKGAAEVAKVAGPALMKGADKVTVGVGVACAAATLSLDKAQEAWNKKDLEREAVKELNETKDSHAIDSAFASHDPSGTVPDTSLITGVSPSLLAPEAAERLRSGSNHISPSTHSLHSATATGTQTWAPNLKVTGQGVRIEFPGSAWPIALASMAVYAVGSWLLSPSESTGGAETSSSDTSAVSLRQKSGSSAPGSHRAAASGDNVIGGGGGGGGGSSDEDEEGEPGKNKRAKGRILPIRNPLLSKTIIDDLLDVKHEDATGKAMHGKLVTMLKERGEGKHVWSNKNFRIDAGRICNDNPDMKSWKLQLNSEADRKYNVLRKGRGTHATLFEGKIDVNNVKPSYEDWKREIMETFD